MIEAIILPDRIVIDNRDWVASPQWRFALLCEIFGRKIGFS